MLSAKLRNTFSDIVTQAIEMVEAHVSKSDLGTGIDFASIYAQSIDEFIKITHELKQNGVVVLERSSGDYYKLDEPLDFASASISCCRVRKYDSEHSEMGYLDFEALNYLSFKAKYLSKPYFTLVNFGEEMLELRNPKFRIRAYFPSGDF